MNKHARLERHALLLNYNNIMLKVKTNSDVAAM